MTLRAVGNLTREDENILRACALGLVATIVAGAEKHSGSTRMLKLCADVLGNMASIAASKLGPDRAAQIFREYDVGGAGEGGGKALRAALASLERENPADVREAVCSVLLDELGAAALVRILSLAGADAPLASSCLRALSCVIQPRAAVMAVPVSARFPF